jgi:hypothetical protein
MGSTEVAPEPKEVNEPTDNNENEPDEPLWWKERQLLNIKPENTDPELLGYKCVELDESKFWTHIDVCFPDDDPIPKSIDIEAGEEIPKDITEIIAQQYDNYNET